MHPILFQIGDFFIGTYGLMLAIGMLAAIGYATRRARTIGLDPNLLLDLCFISILTGLLGGRLTFILVEFPDLLKKFDKEGLGSVFQYYVLTRQGFVFAGGMFTAVAVDIAYLQWRKAPMWLVGDIMGPAIALGHGFGRIGCFFAGCCFGKTCELPWAVQFPPATGPTGQVLGIVYEDHLDRGLIPPGALFSAPVHPVQLYESAVLFGIFILLAWAFSRRRFDGLIFASYLTLYGIARFSLEFLRGDAARGALGALSTSQYMSIAMIAGAAIIVALRFRKGREPYAADPKFLPAGKIGAPSGQPVVKDRA